MRRIDRWLMTVLAWGALSFGAAYPWGYWSVAVIAAGLGVWMIVRTRAWHGRTPKVVSLLLGLVMLAMAVQALSLPRTVVSTVSPALYGVLAQLNVQDLVDPPAWHSLSLSSSATLTAMLLFAALSIFLVGLIAALPFIRLDRFVVSLMAFGALLAVFAVTQRAANIRSPDNDHWQLVYGFWKPRQAGDVFGPFINRNHFAGWMVMALPLALGYSCAALEAAGLSARDRWTEWLRWIARPEASRFMTLALAVAAMGAALTASGSRSGIVSFAVAVAVMAYFVGQRLGRRRLRLLAVGYLGVLLVGAIAWAGLGSAAARFALASADASSRLGAWHDTLRIIRDFPLVGVGVGGYGQAMLVYQTANRDIFFAQAHNDYLQVAAEGGLLVGVPVVLCLVALVRRVRERVVAAADPQAIYWLRAGAISGLAGIAAQSCMDFSLQLAGNTVLFVVLVAIAIHRPSPHASRV